MFDKNIDARLSAWAQHRIDLDLSKTPLQDVFEFWKSAPYIPYNNKVDPYFQFGWPTPWDIIVHNKYDDFTKALMIGWTLKLTNTFKNSLIEIIIYVDKETGLNYNIVCVNKEWAINYNDNEPTLLKDLPESLLLENLIELKTIR
jgi:hypothetical protein